MPHTLRYIALFSTCLAIGACGGKDKKKVQSPGVVSDDTGSSEAVNESDGEKTVVAEGDMRDILLSLRRVHFPFDSTTLNEPSQKALSEAAEKLRTHSEVELKVEGHADSRGTSEYNVALGERRADAVVEYLATSGVERGRLEAVSYGEEQPLADEGDRKARALNRRVDFRLTKGDVRFVLEKGVPLSDGGDPMGDSGDSGEASGDEGEASGEE